MTRIPTPPTPPNARWRRVFRFVLDAGALVATAATAAAAIVRLVKEFFRDGR